MKNKEVNIKSNALIEASYDLNLLETQIILYGISLVNPLTEASEDYVIHVQRFAEIFNKNTKSIYRELKKAALSSFWGKRVVFKNVLGRMEHRAWLITVEYSDGEGFLRVRFHPDIKELLCMLSKNFTVFYLDQVSKFKSVFSIRIYEFCIMEINKKKANDYNFTVSVAWIAERLRLGDKYPRFTDFKRRVLIKAQTEINTHSDLTIEFEEIKKGRRVESIRFIVQRKPGMPRASYAQEENNTEAPAYPPLVQDGNSAYKCSDTQATSKLSSSDGKVNAVMEESGYKSASYTQKLNHAQTATKEETADSAVVSQPQGALPQSQQNKNEASICDNDTNLSNLDAGCKREYTESQREAIYELLKFGIKKENAIETVENYGTSGVMEAVSKVQKAIEKGTDIRSTAGYFVKTLDNNNEIVHDSEQYKALQEAEKLAKAREALDLEETWTNFDRWCTQFHREILYILDMQHNNRPYTSADNRSSHLQEYKYQMDKVLKLKKHNLLLTDIYVEDSRGRHYLTFKQMYDLVTK